MPRRHSNADQVGRGPYAPDAREAIDRIEANRERIGVTVAQLAQRAGISERQLINIRKSGRAFKRKVNALRMALRALEKEQKLAGTLFPRELDE